MILRPVHTPYLYGDHDIQFGLRELDPEDWIEPLADPRRQLTYKRDTHTDWHGKAFCAEPGSEEAGGEALLMLANYLALKYPGDYALWGDRLEIPSLDANFPVRKLGPNHPLLVAGHLVPDDLCLLLPNKKKWKLAAASVCSPGGWSPARHVGKSITAVKAPAFSFGANVKDLLDDLGREQLLWQTNWEIYPTSEPFMPPGSKEAAWAGMQNLTADDAGDRLWLRVERKALRKLPETGAILLTIRTHLDSLSDVASFPDLCDGLLQKLEGHGLNNTSDRSYHAPIVTYLRSQMSSST